MTTIHNQSRETISLIPFSRPNGVDLRKPFDVRKGLAKEIPAGGTEPVKPKDYDSSGTGPGSQIHMLFRCGELPKTVTPGPGEIVFVYTQLGEKPEWRLDLDKKKQVIGGPGSAAGQTSSGANAAGPRIESQLQGLKEEVEKLKKGLKALLDGIADLETALGRRGIIDPL